MTFKDEGQKPLDSPGSCLPACPSLRQSFAARPESSERPETSALTGLSAGVVPSPFVLRLTPTVVMFIHRLSRRAAADCCVVGLCSICQVYKQLGVRYLLHPVKTRIEGLHDQQHMLSHAGSFRPPIDSYRLRLLLAEVLWVKQVWSAMWVHAQPELDFLKHDPADACCWCYFGQVGKNPRIQASDAVLPDCLLPDVHHTRVPDGLVAITLCLHHQ